MHRDISGQNLLILSLNPPEAVVCDYGKAVKAQSSTHSCLGPFEFTAPEVWLGAYDSRIDLWSWALAMAILLGYDHSSTDKITTADISNIQRYLRIRGRDDEGFEAFCRLLRHMLEADPAARPTIAEALEDGCWDAIDDDSEETEQDSDQTDTIHDTIHVKRVRVSEGSN
jgi:serine/threonine protein kinase